MGVKDVGFFYSERLLCRMTIITRLEQPKLSSS